MKKIVSFFAKIISKVHYPYAHKEMKENECIEIIKLLKDMDVVLSHTSGELSNVALSHFGHAGIFCDGKIFEAVTAGAKETDPMFFLAKKDDIIVLRPKFLVRKNDVVYYLKEELGEEYDFDFEINNGHLYCYEYAASALMAGSEEKIQMINTVLGKKYLDKSFLNEKFEIVWRK